MQYKKITNLLNNTSNQLSKFRLENWVEIYDDRRGTHNPNSLIRFKTTMSKSSVCDYTNAYILLKEL